MLRPSLSIRSHQSTPSIIPGKPHAYNVLPARALLSYLRLSAGEANTVTLGRPTGCYVSFSSVKLINGWSSRQGLTIGLPLRGHDDDEKCRVEECECAGCTFACLSSNKQEQTRISWINKTHKPDDRGSCDPGSSVRG